MMDLMELRRDITRLRSDDQYFVTWKEIIDEFFNTDKKCLYATFICVGKKCMC